MEHKFIILGIVIALFSSGCKTPANLPESEDIGVNEFGSHIIVDLNEGAKIEGELITIDGETLKVLSKNENMNQVQTISTSDIKGFKLTYAQPKKYGWTIPVSALVTLSHGYLASYTAPANIIMTSIITARAANAFTYSEENMTWEKLKMFARFPQGLPPQIKVRDIK